jgi:hypothetical protein
MGVVGNRPAPLEISTGRRALEGFDGLSILDDWKWFEDCKRWVLHLRIRIAVPLGSRMPPETDWHVLVDPAYPLGSIKFFPSQKNSFSETYPHQLYNGPGTNETLWRTGELCLNTQVRKYDRYEDEPFESGERLLWHCRRAVLWLNDAANDQLAKEGDPFEVPQFPGMGKDLLVAYAEDSSSLNTWRLNEEVAGLVELFRPQTPKNLLVVKRFFSLRGRELLKCDWGSYLEQEKDGVDLRRGIWIRTPSIPALLPWRAPATWGELRDACRGLQVDLDPLLRKCVAKVRDGRAHLGLIGFPIPEKIGSPISNVYWQPFALPVLANRSLRGFRNSEGSHWQYDRGMNFSDNKPIAWVNSENWDAAQVSTRGKLSDGIRSSSVLLIGAGAVGSALAELLVRGGVQRLLILDSAEVQVGNLTRHTLTMEDVGGPKALGLATRLSKISPHAKVLGHKSEFPPADGVIKQQVDQCGVVIDCTGSDEVVRWLDKYPWEGERVFFSVSTGFDARRIFCFAQRGRFSSSEFFSQVRPWLELERTENRDRELPREGIGCWNPVFPGRADDIWLLVSSVVAVVDDLASVNASNPSLVVFERILSEGRSIGVKKSTSLESERD